MRLKSVSMVAATTAAAAILSVASCSDNGETKTGSAETGSAGTTGAAGTGSAGTTGAAGTGAAGTGVAGTSGAAGSNGAAGTGTAGAAGNTPFEPVTIPATLAAPAGTTLKFQLHAKGAQIYTCTGTVAATDGGTDGGATTYAWTLKAPNADLTNETNQKVGTHYAGPTWKSTDGSDIVGARVAGVDSTLPDAIPWLLLKVSSHMGSGTFADVTYVQRLNTRKGKAPATGCDAAAATAATEVSVDYTADYWFYRGGVSTDGGVVADWPVTPVTIPTDIAAPAGPTVKLRYHALGVQIYTCTGTATAADGGADAGATTYAWVLKAPDAKLYDDTNTQVGTHGAGPNWTSKDGSIVTGTRLTQASSPLSDAIPWLLLQAATHTGTGVFSDVTYVQRVNTTKGKAPTTGCDAGTVNAEVRIDYTADYYFLSGAATSDGGAG